MQYIYTRVSTDKQDGGNQLLRIRQLYPAATIVQEVVSGAKHKPLLTQLIASLKSGDELIVAALDRLGRRTKEILEIIEYLDKTGIILKSLREGVDYSTITGRLVTQILCSVAEMERSLISSRTKDALDAKRSIGIVGGRRPTYSSEVVEQVIELKQQGKSCRTIASVVGMSASRVSQLTKTIDSNWPLR